MANKTYEVISAVGILGERYPVGSVVELSDEHAKAFGKEYLKPTTESVKTAPDAPKGAMTNDKK